MRKKIIFICNDIDNTMLILQGEKEAHWPEEKVKWHAQHHRVSLCAKFKDNFNGPKRNKLKKSARQKKKKKKDYEFSRDILNIKVTEQQIL